MRWRRILLVVVGLVVVLPISAIGIFIATFNANDWKPHIQRAVMRSTGRELSLNGTISLKWSLVPKIEARDVALADIDGLATANGDRARHRGEGGAAVAAHESHRGSAAGGDQAGRSDRDEAGRSRQPGIRQAGRAVTGERIVRRVHAALAAFKPRGADRHRAEQRPQLTESRRTFSGRCVPHRRRCRRTWQCSSAGALNKMALRAGQHRLGLCERQSERRRRATGRDAAAGVHLMHQLRRTASPSPDHCTRPLRFPSYGRFYPGAQGTRPPFGWCPGLTSRLVMRSS